MPPADPAVVIDLIEAFRRSKTMFAALTLGVFDRLSAGPAEALPLALATGAHPDSYERLLDACVSLGLLEKDGGRYSNSPAAAAYLVRSSPSTLAGYAQYSNDVLFKMWGRNTESTLRTLADAFPEAGVTFQVGANDGETILVTMGEIDNVKLTTNNWAKLDSDPANMISNIDKAITAVSAKRSTLGAVQNRLENAMQVQASYQENVMSAESRIRDVDIANEMVSYTKNQILSQAGAAMLAQANQSPQQVLALLR